MMRPDATSHDRGDADAGFSLVEVLIATALLLVIAISVLPLFMRALESNTSGGRSSQLSTFVNADLETVNQATVDHQNWDLSSGTGGVVDLGQRYWDTGVAYDGASMPAHLGDETWVDAETDAVGPILWQRQMTLRKYTFADIHATLGSDPDNPALFTLGHPALFDTPLTAEGDNAHLTELRISIKENREGIPVDTGQRITVSHFRAY